MTATYAEAEHHHGLTDHPDSPTRSLPTILKRQWTKLAIWLEDLERYREATFELRSLTDRELDDIGIARWQIPEIAWRPIADRHSAERD